MSTPRGTAVAGVDVGGTFTDVLLVSASGDLTVVKMPTTAADQSAGMADALAEGLAPDQVLGAVAHGTTTATNAVLERKVARTVLVTTGGFRDLLTIGRQNRPSLYDLDVVRAEPIVPPDLVVTVDERMGPDGAAVAELTEPEVARVVDAVAALEPEAVAVCLLFSYAGPAHELRLGDALRARLAAPVTCSSELLPEFREYERASTCALDASVAPVMTRYLGRVRQRLPSTTVSVMTSAGGVADIDTVARAPVHTLLSGPAAGVVAAAAVARDAGFDDAVAFDMGGTSTDACLITDGRPTLATSGDIGGLPFGTPAVDIHTVGAGGGSIGWVDAGGALRVGPQSAGADPGPACYGRGGSDPTVTDAHVVLGHLLDAQTLGTGGVRLDRRAAEEALAGLDMGDATRAAEGIITVVRAAMLRALRRVSTERGVDPARLALVAFGGAGPLHATALARDLGCPAAVIPTAPGILSALGLLLAPPQREASRTVMVPCEPHAMDLVARTWEELDRQAASAIADAHLEHVADCRYVGQSYELRITEPADGRIAAAFHDAHRAAYGFAMPEEPVEIVTVRSVARGRARLESPPRTWGLQRSTSVDATTVIVQGRERNVRLVDRATLRAGDVVDGPVLVTQQDSTTFLDDGDRAEVHPSGSMVVTW